MNTLTLPANRHRSIYKAGNNIGADTTNRTINLKDDADSILARECRRIGLTISDGARELWARGLATVNRRAASAFRSAQGMARNLASIFQPNLTPAEREAAFAASVEAVKETKATELPTGGAKIADEAIGEFKDGGTFIPKETQTH
jgi:hypothetical protein